MLLVPTAKSYLLLSWSDFAGLALGIAAIALTLTFNISDNAQAITNSPLSSRSAVCLDKSNICSSSLVMEPAIQAAPAPTEASHKPSISVPATTAIKRCQASPVTSAAYQQALLNALSATNTQVDNARAEAENNGEAYQAFDADVNSILAGYNQKVQQIFASYSHTLGNCTSNLQPPQLFGMFMP